MAGEIDALGGLATAALAARELDHAMPHDPGQPGQCANCGAPVTHKFCANCGQAAHVHRSLGHVAEEFLHGLTHFDGKAWKTLPMLIFRPGKLTWDYVHGRRARYIAPVALFLLTVFLMFFAFSFVKGPGDLVLDPKTIAGGTTAERKQTLADSRKAVKDIEAELAQAKADPQRTADVTALQIALATAKAANNAADLAVNGKPLYQSGDDPPILSAAAALTELREADKRGELNVDLGNKTINDRARHALRNPELTLYKIQQKAYKFSFLLVPLSVPVLWLMFFWRRDVYLYDHAVFALYSISFMSLLLVLISVLVSTGWGVALVYVLLIGVVPLLHMFAQLKGAYRLSTFGALWRTGVLSIAAIVTMSLFATMILVLGLVD